MPSYADTSADFPGALARLLAPYKVKDLASDRDAATPRDFCGAHAEHFINEIRAVQSYVMDVTGLQVTDNTGLEVAFSAGRMRVGNGAPLDVAADVLTIADDDTSYIECAANGTVSDNVVGFSAGAFPMATVIASSGDIESVTDDRSAYFLVDASAVDHGGLGGLADDDHEQYILATGARAMAGPWSMGDQDLLDVLELRFQATTKLTIDAGAVTMTQGTHRIDTESAAGTDDLETIGGGNDGAVLLVRAEHTDRTVVLKDGTGNLELGGADISLDDTDQIIALYYDGTLTKWLLVGNAIDHGGLGGLADDDHEQYILASGARAMAGPWSMGDQDLLDVLELRFQATTELTIDAGAVAMTQGTHRIDTESDAGTDDLDTISGANDGALLLVRAEHADRTVVLKDGTGNLELGGADISLDDTDQAVLLYYDGTLTKWLFVGVTGHGTGAAIKDHADVAAAVSDSDVQGDIIHRDAANWTRLAKGTDGQVLKTGASDVAWEDDIFPVVFLIDGGGSPIATGEKGHIEVPAGTILRVTALADQSGSIVVDIWKDIYANFPPTNADSITAAAPVTISAADKSQDSTLTDWIKTMADGDILGYTVDSCATIERCTIILWCKRS